MAEFSEIIKQFKRMCESTTGFECSRGECPVMGYAFGCENISQCRKIAFERPDVFEEKVMAWAAENPEPQFPSWGEYLTQIGVVNFVEPTQTYVHTALFFNPIPADIAKRLGIELKEG